MSDDGERYQVVYFKNDEEVLTESESYDLAHVTARVLHGRGHRVGKVMSESDAQDYMRAKYGRTPETVNPYNPDSATYRGIPVPDRVQRDRVENSPYAAVWTAWREGVDAALDITVPLVESLHFGTPCLFDHHGYCQEHGIPGAILCPDGQAQKFIAATKERGGQ